MFSLAFWDQLKLAPNPASWFERYNYEDKRKRRPQMKINKTIEDGCMDVNTKADLPPVRPSGRDCGVRILFKRVHFGVFSMSPTAGSN